MRLFLTFLLVVGISCAYASNWNNMSIKEKKFIDEDANNLIDKMKHIQNEIENGKSKSGTQGLILRLLDLTTDATIDDLNTAFRSLVSEKYNLGEHLDNENTKDIATKILKLIYPIKDFALKYVKESEFIKDANNLIDKMEYIQNTMENEKSKSSTQGLILDLLDLTTDATIDDLNTAFRSLLVEKYDVGEYFGNENTEDIAMEIITLIYPIKDFAFKSIAEENRKKKEEEDRKAEEERIAEQERIAEENRKKKEEEEKFIRDAKNLINVLKPIEENIVSKKSWLGLQDPISRYFGLESKELNNEREWEKVFNQYMLKYASDKHNANPKTKEYAYTAYTLIVQIKKFVDQYVNKIDSLPKTLIVENGNGVVLNFYRQEVYVGYGREKAGTYILKLHGIYDYKFDGQKYYYQRRSVDKRKIVQTSDGWTIEGIHNDFDLNMKSYLMTDEYVYKNVFKFKSFEDRVLED